MISLHLRDTLIKILKNNTPCWFILSRFDGSPRHTVQMFSVFT